MSEKYKLAILVSHPIQYYYRLYQELAAHPRIDLTVYFCWDAGVGSDGAYDHEFKLRVKWDLPLLEGYRYRFLKNYSPRPSSSFWGLINPGVMREIYTQKFDAIFVWGYNYLSSWLAFLAARLRNTPVFLGGSGIVYPDGSPVRMKVKKLILETLCRNVSAFLVECERNSDYYKYFGALPEKVFRVPAAVDNEFFQSRAAELIPRRAEIKKDLKIDPDRPVILYVGKLTENKRVKDLLDAYREIEVGSGATLLIVGDGEEKERLLKTVEECGIRRVIFTGFKNQTDLPYYFSISDVFVLPSRKDFSPRVLNEAMNFGLPLIVSDGVGTSGDLVQDDRNGFIYSMGNISELSRKMRRLLLDQNLRKMMGEQSRAIIQKWSYRVGMEGILNALGSIEQLKVNIY